MSWQDSYTTTEDLGRGAFWVDFFAVAIGAGAMLLILHMLHLLTLIYWLASLI